MEELRKDNEIKKCIYGKCDHEVREHKEGSCFHITQDDLADKQTTKKYCPCGLSEGKNHRLFDTIGYMESTVEDQMVTKTCTRCDNDFLLNTEETECKFCRSL